MTRFSATEVQKILAQEGYGEIKENNEPRPEPPPAKAMREKLERKAKGNKLAAEFEQVWRALGGPVLDTEVQFAVGRKWRMDYCHLASRTAIEIEGGVWSKGRHTRPQGFLNDCEKYNNAALLGYTVFRLATGMMDTKNVQPIIDYVKGNT